MPTAPARPPCVSATRTHHEFNGKKLVTRIGLHTGVANVGNFGSDNRVDYTAIGENINLASRMEGLNKYLGTRVLITGDTHQGIGARLVTRYLGLFRLKGFEKAVEVYELIGRAGTSRKNPRTCASASSKRRALFVKKDFAGAEAAFRRVLEIEPNDGPAKFYLEQIEEFRSKNCRRIGRRNHPQGQIARLCQNTVKPSTPQTGQTPPAAR